MHGSFIVASILTHYLRDEFLSAKLCCYRITVIDGLTCRCFVWPISLFIWSHPLIDLSFYTHQLCAYVCKRNHISLNVPEHDLHQICVISSVGCTKEAIVYHVRNVCTVFWLSEKLKFTPTPQPAQCLELDNKITIQCSAKGRESPTIRWTKAGVHAAGLTITQNNLNQISNDCLTLSWGNISSKMQPYPSFLLF